MLHVWVTFLLRGCTLFSNLFIPFSPRRVYLFLHFPSVCRTRCRAHPLSVTVLVFCERRVFTALNLSGRVSFRWWREQNAAAVPTTTLPRRHCILATATLLPQYLHHLLAKLPSSITLFINHMVDTSQWITVLAPLTLMTKGHLVLTAARVNIPLWPLCFNMAASWWKSTNSPRPDIVNPATEWSSFCPAPQRATKITTKWYSHLSTDTF